MDNLGKVPPGKALGSAAGKDKGKAGQASVGQAKGSIRMSFRLETIDGVEYLIGERGEHLHQIDLRAVSSWGMLLGLSDPVEIVEAILRTEDVPAGFGQPNMWTDLYGAIGDGLDELSQAGVPAEYAEEVIESDAPYPSEEVMTRIRNARAATKAKIGKDPDKWGNVRPALAAVLAGREEAVAEARVEFVDALAPVYEIPPEPAPRSVPEALDVANWRTTGIKPRILER